MNNLSLYEISQDYLQALDVFTDPEADIPLEAAMDTLEGIEGQLQDKAVNVAKFMQNLDATARAIKEAEQKMATRRKAIENRARWIKDYLKSNMEAAGITKIESPWFRLAIQKNPGAVEIIDEASLPDDFKTEVVTVKIDKAAIKQAIRGGAEVPGAILSQGTRLVVR
ncbi:MAG TPA: siphovirus Gp157 family protein [Sedimenticola sp.]|nr:siphovirus Gp157 family protein [Sedimenticola sp.]